MDRSTCTQGQGSPGRIGWSRADYGPLRVVVLTVTVTHDHRGAAVVREP